MAPVIHIEVRDAKGRLLQRLKHREPELRVGRGFANDLILDDPHVDAEHLVLEVADDGSVRVTDLGSLNGTELATGPLKGESKTWEPGTTIRVGLTQLRTVQDDDPVPPAALLSGSAAKLVDYSWLQVSLLLVAAMLVGGLRTWFTDFEKADPAAVVGYFFALPFLALLWGGAWALGTKLFTKKAQFRHHVGFASFLTLLATVFSAAMLWVNFALGSSALAWVSEWVFQGVGLIFLGLYGHIDIASRKPRRTKGVIAACLTAATLFLAHFGGEAATSPADRVVFSQRPIRPLPPGLTRSVELDVFLLEIGEMREELAEQAEELRNADR